MNKNLPSLALAVALGAGGMYAALTRAPATESSSRAAAPVDSPRADEPSEAVEDDQGLPPGHPAIGNVAATNGQDLPPGHPAIGGGANAMPQGLPGAATGAAADSDPALTWKVPATWPAAPNPSTMRLATHKVPHARGDSEDAELSISRAGGDVDANITRWAGQFGSSAQAKRREKTVHGVKISIVEVEGEFQGGMGMSNGPHPGWALLGAIAAAPGQPYFFKLTGPAATVKAARAGFDSMLESVAAAPKP